MKARGMLRTALALATVAPLAFAAASGTAQALDKLKVAKSVATADTFTPLDVGKHAGIWKKNGLDLEILIFNGASQAQQALTSGTTEVALGSGPSLAFVAKGVPAKGIAAFAGAPKVMALAVSPESGINSVNDLKGKKIGVTSKGSLTNWLVKETSRRQGWGPDDVLSVPLGSTRTRLAAMKRGEIDGLVTIVATALQLEEQGTAKLLLSFGDQVPDFITHVFFARDDVIEKRPDVLRRFLVGWWQTIAWMKTHKAESIDVISDVIKVKKPILNKSFDYMISMMTDDGTFDPKALKVLSRSFVELGILDEQPDMSRLYTTKFLPVKY